MTAFMTTVFVIGLALLSFGAWLAYEPAGFLVAGFALIVVPLVWIRGTWLAS